MQVDVHISTFNSKTLNDCSQHIANDIVYWLVVISLFLNRLT